MTPSFVVLACCLALASATEYKDCGSKAVVKSFDLEGCPDGEQVCKTPGGRPLRVSVELEATQQVDAATVGFYDIGPNVHRAFKRNGCQEFECPLRAGQTLTYTTNYTRPNIDDRNVDLRMDIVGDPGHAFLFCAVVKTQVYRP